MLNSYISKDPSLKRHWYFLEILYVLDKEKLCQDILSSVRRDLLKGELLDVKMYFTENTLHTPLQNQHDRSMKKK